MSKAKFDEAMENFRIASEAVFQIGRTAWEPYDAKVMTKYQRGLLVQYIASCERFAGEMLKYYRDEYFDEVKSDDPIAESAGQGKAETRREFQS